MFKLPAMDMVEGFEGRQTNHIEKVHLKSKSENDFGGAVEFTQDLENRINDILGK